MTKASSANLEMAIILPLGVVANQLMKIEADLRHLNMKTLDFVNEDGGGRHTVLIEARLENINEALDSIRRLVSDMEADIHPWSAEMTHASAKEYSSRAGTHLALEDDSLPPPDTVHSKYSNRKSAPDRDD
jgi:paraquat-inducible protein B